MVGDQALIHLSEIISHNMRATDLLGRWAGDEFLLLLPDTTPDDSLAMARRLHQQIGNTSLILPLGNPLHISTSIGVAGVDHAQYIVNNMDQLIRWADQAMYEAKAAGRNQVQIHLE
jgi:diguanylate cyclase